MVVVVVVVVVVVAVVVAVVVVVVAGVVVVVVVVVISSSKGTSSSSSWRRRRSSIPSSGSSCCVAMVANGTSNYCLLMTLCTYHRSTSSLICTDCSMEEFMTLPLRYLRCSASSTSRSVKFVSVSSLQGTQTYRSSIVLPGT